MARGVDDNRPVGVTTTFTIEDNAIFCSARLSRAPRDTVVKAKWIYVKGELEELSNEVLATGSVTSSGTQYISFSLLRGNQIWARGEYRVILSIADKELVDLPFEIKTPPTPQVKILETSVPDFSSGEVISRTYSWQYKGKDWHWKMEIPKLLYDNYKNKARIPTVDPSVYSVYVTHPIDDEAIGSLVNLIERVAETEGFDEFEKLEFAITFVQSLPYTVDSATTSYDEYPRYPIETLVDGGGDCEDTSILLASLVDAMGIMCVLFIHSNHCAVGVGAEGVAGTCYVHEGVKYYYVETTNSGWAIGQIPTVYRLEKPNVASLNPIPIIAHSPSYLEIGKLIKAEVIVENLGSAECESIQTVAVFETNSKHIYSSQQSEPFTLGVDGKAKVIFYLDFPFAERNRLVIKTFYDNRTIESHNEWSRK